MELKNLADLPFVFQVIAGLGIFFGTFMLAVGGWVWKQVKPKMPAAVQAIDNTTKEAPVSSLQVLDSRIFARLSESITDLVQHLRQNSDDSERDLTRGFDNLDKSMLDVCRELGRTTEALRRIEILLEKRTLL